jgi:hypothetical protein
MLQSLTILTAVTSRMEGGQGGFRLSSIGTFFVLPKLRLIRGVACFEPEDDLFTNFDCPDRTSNVREIRLFRSAICPLGLRQMITACKALDKFTCDWAGISLGWVEVNFPLLRIALVDHKSTLNTLGLNTAKHYDSWPERDNGLVPPFGSSLAEFKELKTLDVPASCLIGWDEDDVGGYASLKDILPPNLEVLKINEFAPRLMDSLDDLALVCAERYPKLKKLTMSRVFPGTVDVEENLVRKFAELAPGVKVVFVDGEEVDHFDESIDVSTP